MEIEHFFCILRVIFQWQFHFSRNGVFPTYNGILVFCANSLRSSSFCKSEDKVGIGKFFIRVSNFNLCQGFLTRFFDKKPRKWSSSKSLLNIGIFLFKFSFSSFLF